MKNKLFATIIILCTIFLAGCRNQKSNTDEEKPTVALSLASVTEYARMLEKSVLADNPNPNIFENAFDTVAIKAKIAKNTIAASALDLDYGKFIFDGNLNYGLRAVDAVENGGDFRLDTCYQDENGYHAIFRIYDTIGGVEFDDFLIGMSGKGELKIQDCFIYNLSCWLTDKMESEIVYNAMRNMNESDSSTNLMGKIVLLNEMHDYQGLLQLLKENKSLAAQYPAYNMYYLIAIKNISKDYVSDLMWLKETGIDERFLLVHQMSYYANKAMMDSWLETIDKLMNHTGEDPIFWVLTGKILTDTGDYKTALGALNNARIGLGNYLWDIWIYELRCYKALKDDAAFDACLAAGEKLFGMNQKELKELRTNL